MRYYYVHQVSTHGVKRTIRVEKVLTRRDAYGHTSRLLYGKWYTTFGGWTSRAEWHLVSV